jgi:TatD DNase family protein
MKLFDTHTHLQDDRIWDQHESIISRALDAGVQVMVCCGSCEDDWERVYYLSRKFPKNIIPAYGLHPWYISNRTKKWKSKLEEMLMETPTAAVGEIGLDHAIVNRNDSDQRQIFIEQLQMATALKRPVSIHCRKAWLELQKCIIDLHSPLYGGAIHSYSGSSELIPEFIKNGLMISFSGSITYGQNRKARQALLHVPEDKLLIETDAPDILCQGRTGLNEPSFLNDTIVTIAGLLNQQVNAIAQKTFENGTKLFGWKNQ